jgi:hypothetical protein
MDNRKFKMADYRKQNVKLGHELFVSYVRQIMTECPDADYISVMS